jgi:hypothetical protein
MMSVSRDVAAVAQLVRVRSMRLLALFIGLLFAKRDLSHLTIAEANDPFAEQLHRVCPDTVPWLISFSLDGPNRRFCEVHRHE